MTDENKRLKEQVKKLKKENERLKKSLEIERSDAWDFHYSGHGNYEQERAGFYGDFQDKEET